MQMLDSDIAKRNKKKNQKQFSVSDRSAHKNQYPFLKEFSELISIVPINILKTILLSPEQDNLAKSLWEANKSKKELYSDYQPKINSLKEYYELVLILDHKKQWDEYTKSATILKDRILE